MQVFSLVYWFYRRFFFNNIARLVNNNTINNYLTKLVNGQKLFYKPIYCLKLVKLEILKSYLKINFTNNFIKFFKFVASTSIIFIRKANNSFWLYVNY